MAETKTTTKYEIRDATKEDVEFLSTRLRSMDIEEIMAMSGRSAGAVLRSGLLTSDICRVGIADGTPICIYGVRPKGMFSNTGIVWMLGTDDLAYHSMKFIRECRDQVEEMMEGYVVLENWCLSENYTTMRWLKWLGFKFDKPVLGGRKHKYLTRFYMESENV